MGLCYLQSHFHFRSLMHSEQLSWIKNGLVQIIKKYTYLVYQFELWNHFHMCKYCLVSHSDNRGHHLWKKKMSPKVLAEVTKSHKIHGETMSQNKQRQKDYSNHKPCSYCTVAFIQWKTTSVDQRHIHWRWRYSSVIKNYYIKGACWVSSTHVATHRQLYL